MGKRKEEKELLETFDAYGGDPEVLREWDLKVERTRQIRGVLRLDTSNGFRMLKRITTSVARLRFIHGVTEHLSTHGFPYVPRFIRTKYGDPFVVHPTGLYYLTERLPGKEADLKKTKNIFQAAETLARLHKAGEGFEGGGFGQETREDFTVQWGKYQAKLQSYDAHLEDVREQTVMDQLYLEHRKDLAQMIGHASEQLSNSPYSEILAWARENKTICHGSFSRQNLLTDKERFYVVDFDHCHYGHPVHDIGALLTRYMPRYEWDSEIGFSILDVYRNARTISAEEMTVLAAYLAFPHRTLQVVEAYFERTRDWDVEKFASRFRKALKLDNARETFVHDLIDRYNLSLDAPSFAPQVEGIDSYDDELDESSSVEGRNDGWEENEVEADAQAAKARKAPASVFEVDIDEEETEVALASNAEIDDAEQFGDESAPLVRASRQKRRKQAQDALRKPRPQGDGPWIPNQ